MSLNFEYMVPKLLSEHHVQLGMLVVWASPNSFGEMILVMENAHPAPFVLKKTSETIGQMVPLRSRNRKIANVHPWLHVVTLVFFSEEVRRLIEDCVYIYIYIQSIPR